jgi:hypothetical protein
MLANLPFIFLFLFSANAALLTLCDAIAKGKLMMGLVNGDLPDDQKSRFPDGLPEDSFESSLNSQGWTFDGDANNGDAFGVLPLLGATSQRTAATISLENTVPSVGT